MGPDPKEVTLMDVDMGLRGPDAVILGQILQPGNDRGYGGLRQSQFLQLAPGLADEISEFDLGGFRLCRDPAKQSSSCRSAASDVAICRQVQTRGAHR